MNFKTFLVYSFFNVIIYAIPASWLFSQDGWLKQLGGIDYGCGVGVQSLSLCSFSTFQLDYFCVATLCASGNVTYVHQVVHLVGGFSALVVTTYLGPRQILEQQYTGRKQNYISGLDSNTALKRW